jgi:hypothetical protein
MTATGKRDFMAKRERKKVEMELYNERNGNKRV